MTQNEFSIFLNGAAGLCALMVLLNLALLKRKGPSAGILACAFLVCGGVILAVARAGITPVTYVGGGVVVALMIADFVYRSSKKAN